jgi:hypothetical protein
VTNISYIISLDLCTFASIIAHDIFDMLYKYLIVKYRHYNVIVNVIIEASLLHGMW